MDQNTKKTALMNWLVLLGAVIGMLLVAEYVRSAAALMGTILTGFGLLVALLGYLHIGLLEREQFEKMEIEELSKSRGSESLFATAGADTFPARRSREQFEKFFIPGFTILLFAAQGAGAFFPWKGLAVRPPLIPANAKLAMSLLGLMGLILFLLGKYSSGLARLKGLRLLRPGAAYMQLGAFATLAVIGGIAAVLGGAPNADLIVARVLCVVSGLAAVETLLSLVLESYRVRVQGRETRLLYESRLVGLLGQPEAIITTAAHALDYQFGFKVSDTWFYRFLEKALVWLILAQLAILEISTCFVIIEPGDQALRERWGEPTGVIGPGMNLKWPWPVGKTIVYHTDRIQTFLVGAEPERTETIAWAVSHAKEESFLVAGKQSAQVSSPQTPAANNPPVNLLSVSIPVQFQITNLYDWAYQNEDPVSLLTNAAEHSVVQYLANADFDDLMSQGRGQAAESLRQDLQQQATDMKLGARIIFVGLEDIHPPTKVAGIFEKVVAAAETREATILQANAHALVTNSWAIGESIKRVNTAEAFRDGTITNAAARAILFADQELAYSAAPGAGGIYEQQAYLEALTNSADARKFILATTNQTIPIFDLEDKVRPDLLIDKLPAPTSK
ncbi:MAG TPA: protease modulator HflK [Verrucomicrobiae bacterium]|jgi:regulator of protease activity HflC (stomatin/prohibitin superfamily)